MLKIRNDDFLLYSNFRYKWKIYAIPRLYCPSRIDNQVGSDIFALDALNLRCLIKRISSVKILENQ